MIVPFLLKSGFSCVTVKLRLTQTLHNEEQYHLQCPENNKERGQYFDDTTVTPCI